MQLNEVCIEPCNSNKCTASSAKALVLSQSPRANEVISAPGRVLVIIDNGNIYDNMVSRNCLMMMPPSYLQPTGYSK